MPYLGVDLVHLEEPCDLATMKIVRDYESAKGEYEDIHSYAEQVNDAYLRRMGGSLEQMRMFFEPTRSTP